jgi:hypothetical protein
LSSWISAIFYFFLDQFFFSKRKTQCPSTSFFVRRYIFNQNFLRMSKDHHIQCPKNVSPNMKIELLNKYVMKCLNPQISCHHQYSSNAITISSTLMFLFFFYLSHLLLFYDVILSHNTSKRSFSSVLSMINSICKYNSHWNFI